MVVAATMGVVSVADSYLLTKRMPSLRAFFIPVGLFHLGFGLLFLWLYPLPSGVPVFTWFIVGVGAVMRLVSAVLMLYAMQSEEVSRVTPVVNTYPVFVAILAVPLLGEVLNYLQWLAVMMTVAGAVLISTKGWGRGRRVRLRGSFLVLIVSSLLSGGTNIATKYALGDLSFWNVYSTMSIFFGAALLLMALRPSVLRELRGMKGRSGALSLIVVTEIIALVGILLSFWAMEEGPISLVSTVMGARPLFVFLYALLLSRALPGVLDEKMTRGVVALKFVSIALIMGGVAIVNVLGPAAALGG